MYWTLGSRIHQVDTKTLIRAGWLVQAEVEEVDTEFEFEYEGPDSKRMAVLTRRLVNDEKRNELIARRAADEVERGETIFLLSNNKSHCAKLGRLLEKYGVRPAVLVGSVRKEDRDAGLTGDMVRYKKKDRKRALQDMRDGNERVIIATSLADEGINIVNLSRVMLALPSSSPRLVEQQVGRSMRPYEGKYPKLIDFVDRKVDTLVNRFRARKRVYKKLGLI
jgi:superfamily II DNA or RNA helicase